LGCLAFRVLGPVEAVRDGVVVPLGRRTLTDLFAVLAVSPGQVVTTEAIIQAVWHAGAPAHPRATLHSAVARLRRMIGEDFIQTHPSGYTFQATASDLDLLRFEELRATAARPPHTGPPRTQPQHAESALAALTEAVALWRGTPLEKRRFACPAGQRGSPADGALPGCLRRLG
jgi:DNA-binding winged helix-turn-helix (wHTH) protein